MPSSRDALKVAGPGKCSICDQFSMLFGKVKRLCRDCAHENDYWTQSDDVEEAMITVIDLIAAGKPVDPELHLAFGLVRKLSRTAQNNP